VLGKGNLAVVDCKTLPMEVDYFVVSAVLVYEEVGRLDINLGIGVY
jgi:hypothetical protein